METGKKSKIVSAALYWIFSICAAILILVVAEVLLRSFWPQTERIVRSNDKSLGMEDSLLGHVFRPLAHQTVERPEFTAEYEINRDGLRDKSIHPDPKPPGLTRVLILGDSFAFGEGNDYNKIWPVLFEQALRERGYQVDVVKAGVAGYDTRTEMLYLERLFPRYDPDVVVIAFLPNDLFTNLPIEGNSEGGGQPSSAREAGDGDDITGTAVRFRGQKTGRLHSVILFKRLLLLNDFMYSRIYSITARKEYFCVPSSARVQRQIDVTKSLLLKAQSYCSQRDTRLVVLSIPQQFQVIVEANGQRLGGVDVHFIDRTFSEFAIQHGITWVQALPVLAGRYGTDGQDLYYRLDGHLNNRGNRVVADFISTWFIDNVMTP